MTVNKRFVQLMLLWLCVCVVHERAHLWLQFSLLPEGA